MSKHTPGPWTVNYRRVTPVAGKQDGTDDVCHVYGDNEANARLIAAAPQLLAALKAVEWRGDTSSPICPFCGNSEHHPDCQLHAAIVAGEGT